MQKLHTPDQANPWRTGSRGLGWRSLIPQAAFQMLAVDLRIDPLHLSQGTGGDEAHFLIGLNYLKSAKLQFDLADLEESHAIAMFQLGRNI